MIGKANWDETRQRFSAWWKQEDTGRPLMRIVARNGYNGPLPEVAPIVKDEELYLDVDRIIALNRAYFLQHDFLAEAFPQVSVDLGAGSMAIYLGCTPAFAKDTVWFEPIIEDLTAYPAIAYDAGNVWWNRHIQLLKRAVELARGEFPINIPDIIENADTISAMRSPQPFCYDLMDIPGEVKKRLDEVENAFFQYFNTIYELVKMEDGSSTYTAFAIWGEGKTAKIQCDFCCMVSPGVFRDMMLPGFKRECKLLNNTLFHLDGPGAVKHLPALMEIDELNALQWTSGAGQPDGASEKWYPIYDKVVDAGKGLHISIYDGDYENWLDEAKRLVRRYGSKPLYLLFPAMERKQAEQLMLSVER